MSLSWSQEAYIKAYQFAAQAHQCQLMPGTNLPYIMHLSFVSMEIIAALTVEKVSSPDLAIQCALLHDVIEDTGKTYDEIKAVFDINIADGVLALSKDKKIDKYEQMEDSLSRIKKQPKEIWMVKLADRISNLQPPPPDWTQEKITRYRDEAIRIHEVLKRASPYLSSRLLEKIDHYSMHIKVLVA